MIVILEGPDCGGKDFQAAFICQAAAEDGLEVRQLAYGPPDPPSRSPFEEYERDLLRFLDDGPVLPETVVIVNRHALGEPVYGPLLRGKSRLTPGGLLHVEMLTTALGAAKFMMLPPIATLVSRMRSRKDDMIDEGELAYLHAEYAKLAVLCRYEAREKSLMPDDLRPLMWGWESSANLADAIAHSAPGYIGSLMPRTVLAGDVRAGNDDPDPPFIHAFTPAAQGSASFLMDALAPYSRQVLAGYGILNTGEAGMDLAAADKVLGEPRWIALGANASARLAEAGLSHRTIPHPSWVRRFRRMTTEEYGKLIIETGQPYAGTGVPGRITSLPRSHRDAPCQGRACQA